MNTKKMLLVFLFASFILTSCKTNEPPEIKVLSNKMDILYSVGLDIWNGNKYDRKSTLEIYMDENNLSDLNTLTVTPLDSEINIEFLKAKPDSVSMIEYLLTYDGKLKYDESIINNIELDLDKNDYKFILTPNVNSALSSNSDDYSPGKTFRGFVLKCTFGKNECEYGFVVRTDAQYVNCHF